MMSKIEKNEFGKRCSCRAHSAGSATEVILASPPPSETSGGADCWLLSALTGCDAVSELAADGAGASSLAALASVVGTGTADFCWVSRAKI